MWHSHASNKQPLLPRLAGCLIGHLLVFVAHFLKMCSGHINK